ncbi:MAG: sarcosine oxidase subunit gamma [Proteobacteria bacterium]|nr:sarcosine oxidase subunit gamma [Pseudomonadota bacterium]
MTKAAAVFTRPSPLAAVARAGRFGADRGAPGVLLSVVHPLSLVTVIARSGKSKATSEVLAGLRNATAMWSGPDQYYVKSSSHGEGALFAELRKKLAGIASVIDQSHGRVTIRISGEKAVAVLAKGTPVDLHPVHFAIGKSALTQMAHVGIHLTRTGEDSFELSVFRGFAESFWEWLCEMSLEFGYQVA